MKAQTTLPLLLLLALSLQAFPRQHRVSVGLRTAGTYDFEPGNDYYPGLEAGVAPGGWFRHRLDFRLAFLTNRLEGAAGRNVVLEDFYLLSSTWHFRPQRRLDPYLRADFGWSRFDTEGLDIPDNVSRVTALLAGIDVSPAPGRFSFYYDFGYSFNASHTVYPGTFSAGFRFHVFPRGVHAL